MKAFLLLAIAGVLGVGCDKPSLDVNLRAPKEPGGCEHIWSKWNSFSDNPDYDFVREVNKASRARKLKLPVPKKTPLYIPTTGGLPVRYQTRTCSKCNLVVGH